MNEMISVGSYICLSFKELYKKNGANLKYGGHIDFHSDEDDEFYELLTFEPDDARSELIGWDGEEWKVVDEKKDRICLQNTANGKTLELSFDEFSIAMFI